MSNELKITRHFKASQDKVFNAWTKPEFLSQWMGPGNVSCIKIELDLCVDGAYELHMQTDDGVMIAQGVYKTIEPNEVLAFTWSWRDSEMPESLVTISFVEFQGGTEMTLHHVMLPSEEAVQHHTVGWNGSIDKLQDFLLN